jgi:hypothetical protein
MGRMSAPHVLPACGFSCFRGGVRRIFKEQVYIIAFYGRASRSRIGPGGCRGFVAVRYRTRMVEPAHATCGWERENRMVRPILPSKRGGRNWPMSASRKNGGCCCEKRCGGTTSNLPMLRCGHEKGDVMNEGHRERLSSLLKCLRIDIHREKRIT